MTNPPVILPVRGLADREARLIEADPPLAALHRRAGGMPLGEIVIPQLAALIRLVARLQVPAFRSVRTADDGYDIELAVHARPDQGQVLIEIGTWDINTATTDAPVPADGPISLSESPSADHPAQFSWAVDAVLVVTEMAPHVAVCLNLPLSDIVGFPLTRTFTLLAAADGSMPMLDAYARKTGFSDQPAALVEGRGGYRLSAMPIFEGVHFRGFRGQALRDPSEKAVPESPTLATTGLDETVGGDIGQVLRAPLDHIIADAEIIRDRKAGPLRHGYADYAADIAAAGRHLMSLVDDLIDVETIEQPDFKPGVEMIDLCAVMRQAASLLGVRAEARSIRIEVSCEDEPFLACAEERRVLQILVNLLGNAVRHSPKGGLVRLESYHEGEAALVTVEDQGPGIAPEDQTRIFEKFERLDRSDPSGSGLGLYISRRLVRAMGGDLRVESKPGQGARFRLALPVREGQRLATGT